MTHVLDEVKRLAILKKKTNVELSLNDIRIILGCFKAIAYQSEIDNEPYLDPDACDLQRRLESQYVGLLKENGATSGAS